jgi:hypothetical protein
MHQLLAGRLTAHRTSCTRSPSTFQPSWQSSLYVLTPTGFGIRPSPSVRIVSGRIAFMSGVLDDDGRRNIDGSDSTLLDFELSGHGNLMHASDFRETPSRELCGAKRGHDDELKGPDVRWSLNHSTPLQTRNVVAGDSPPAQRGSDDSFDTLNPHRMALVRARAGGPKSSRKQVNAVYHRLTRQTRSARGPLTWSSSSSNATASPTWSSLKAVPSFRSAR